MESLARRIQVLEDREEIKEVVAKYSLHILSDETAKIPALFADDGVFRIDSSALRIAGREALTAFYKRMSPGTSFPVVHSTTIVLEGDTAQHIGVLDNPAHVEGRKGYLGIYHDQLRRVDGRRRFTERSFTFLRGEPRISTST